MSHGPIYDEEAMGLVQALLDSPVWNKVLKPYFDSEYRKAFALLSDRGEDRKKEHPDELLWATLKVIEGLVREMQTVMDALSEKQLEEALVEEELLSESRLDAAVDLGHSADRSRYPTPDNKGD